MALAENRTALADLNGAWIDRFHDHNGLKFIVLDMDSSVSPTHGDQEGAAWNGHFNCTCYHPRWDGCRPPQTASQCAKVVVLKPTQAERTARSRI